MCAMPRILGRAAGACAARGRARRAMTKVLMGTRIPPNGICAQGGALGQGMGLPHIKRRLQSGIAMFSSRFRWESPPNRLTQLLEGKRRSGVRILDLTESNPTRAGLAYPPGLLEGFADRRILNYEPEPAGLSSARQ